MEDKHGLWYIVIAAMSQLTKLVYVSVLWILGCISIVTIGVSSASAYYTVVKSIRYHRGGIRSCFFQSFRMNLKDGVIISFIILFGGGLLLFYYLSSGGIVTLHRVYQVLVILVTILLTAILIWICPVFSRFSQSVSCTLSATVVMALGHPFRTFVAICLLALAGLAVFWSLPLITIVPGLYFWGISFLIEPVLRASANKANTEDTDAWYIE